MEYLVNDLKEQLLIRRKNEYEALEKWNKENNKELSLISSGKLIELDFVIKAITDLLNYYNKTRNSKE